MSDQAKEYRHLFGMQGFSAELLHNHFNVYQEYIHKRNALTATLEKLSKTGQADSSQYAGLRRRLRHEHGCVYLHELYFENLGGQNEGSLGDSLARKIAGNFGSYEEWKKDFKTTASLHGVGWAVLCQDQATGTLNNFWLDEEQSEILENRKPLLVLDAWEHSYMMDYGLRRQDYLESFFKNIDWDVVDQRVVI